MSADIGLPSEIEVTREIGFLKTRQAARPDGLHAFFQRF